MIFALNAKIILQSISVILSLVMITYFLLKAKRSWIFYCYLWCQVLIFIWSIGQIFEMMSVDTQSKWMFVAFEYSAICFTGASWLIFSLLYTDFKFGFTKYIAVCIFIPPIVLYSHLLTNDRHKLFYTLFEYNRRVYGPFFWCNILFTYICVMMGTILLIRYSIKQIGYAKRQSVLLISAALLPFASNVLYVLKIINPGFDITPVSFSFSLMFFAIAAFKYGFLNILPIALRETVDNLTEAILVVDNFNKVVDFNQAFTESFPLALPLKRSCGSGRRLKQDSRIL